MTGKTFLRAAVIATVATVAASSSAIAQTVPGPQRELHAGIRSVKSELGKTRNADASHAHERLGWKTRDEEQTIVDCAKSLIEHGVVKV